MKSKLFIIGIILALTSASARAADPTPPYTWHGDRWILGDLYVNQVFGNVSSATITDVSNQIPQDDLEYILSELWARPIGDDILDTVFQNKFGILVHPADGIFGSIIDNSTNWTTAYDERRQWDGGSTNLNAATGRTSLELSTYYSGINHNHGFGSAGTIPKYSNNSGGLANSVIIEYASRIGIGTTPGVLLDVQTSVAGPYNIFKLLNTNTENRTTYGFIGQGLATGRSLGWGFQDNSDGTSGYGWMSVYGDAAGAALVIKKGGNIGIGTTSPAYKLDVNGSARIVASATSGVPSHVATQTGSDNVLKWQTWGDFINNLALTGEIGGGNIGGTGSAGYVAKFIDSATLANSQIQDDGTNIAIGKTPVTGIKLDVAGNIRAQDDLAASTLTVGTVSKANVSSATVADASNQIPTDTLEYITADLWYRLGIAYGWGNHASAGYAAGSHNHGTGTTGKLPKWSDTSGNLTDSIFTETVSGNIGLATTTPTSRLHIVGTNNNDINGITLGTLNTPYRTVKGRIGHNYDSMYITNNASYVGGAWTRDESSGAQMIGFDNFGDASAIRFLTGGTSGLPPERMTITNAGNVGIGIISPAYLLDVSGEIGANKINFRDTYGDKILMKGSIFRVNLDVNEYNMFSDRYFTMSSDTNADAFIFDADIGDVTIEGRYNGDGSGLSYVDADTLDGRSGNDFVERVGDSMYGDLDMTIAKIVFDASADIKLRFGTDYNIEIAPYTMSFQSDRDFLFKNNEGLSLLKLDGANSKAIVYSELDLQANNLTQANKVHLNSIVFDSARTEATEAALLAALETGETVLWKPAGQPLAMAVKYGSNDLRWQTLTTMAEAQNYPNDKYALAIEYNGEVYLAQVHRGY